MCTRPLKILSRKADKQPVFDKLSYIVPCGHCEECKYDKRNSWSVRLYYQWQECIDNGGFALFETLTYNQKTIPVCHGFYCFSVSDIQKYIKRCRAALVRRYPHVDIQHNIKYALFSEYGGKTHRPHYHIVWFVLVNLPRWTVRHLLDVQWSQWNGFIKYGSRNYGFIDSAAGLKYCAKYCCKDVYEDKYLSELVINLKNNGVSDEELKLFRPPLLTSNGIGLYALKSQDYEQMKRGTINIPDKELTIRAAKLPLYYERKLFYDVKFRAYDFHRKDYVFYDRKRDIPVDVDYIPVYVLNSRGVEMKEARFDKYINAARNVYRSAMFLMFPDLEQINKKFELEFDCVESLREFAFTLPENVFIDYVTVYRGSVPASGTFSSLHSISCPLDDFKTILNVRNGIVYDHVAHQSYLDNLLSYLEIPDIDLKCDIIYFLYSLAQRTLEKARIEDEFAYVERKSVYLQQTENFYYEENFAI